MRLLQLFILFIGLNSINGCVSQTEPALPKQPSSAMTDNISQLALEKSKALGEKGKEFEQKQQYDEAVILTRQAIFKAQEAARSDGLVLFIRWQWQLGRIFKAQGKINQAIVAYQQALQVLVPEGTFRWEMKEYGMPGEVSLYQELRHFFFQLADLLLQRAATETNPAKKQHDLRQARKTIEHLKQADVENYFGNCVTAFQKNGKRLDEIQDARTAVIYPILLAERLELLVSFPNQEASSTLHRFSVPVGLDTVREEVRQFREQLDVGYLQPKSTSFKRNAQQLYSWLIEPLEHQLSQQGIDTLVFVPEGVLHTIPMAALYDGNQFLMENFAVAITPGLSLTAPKADRLISDNLQALLGGITMETQGYPKLLYAPFEIEKISQLYSHSDRLLNEQFTETELTKALNNQDYSLVHFISHAEFADNAAQSFMVTFDGTLTLEELATLIQPTQQRKTPIELLTLSACNTAEGDNEWAALGLSGMAVKAGARSVLATLWKAHDETTYHLITRFYKALEDKKSKAQALQSAQKDLLDSSYHHPFYWAPLVLIGNWL
ncbi:MAG TPA: CHAT domain-containing protein [Thiotrichaceae bacterium]|nr:CHAT domain-containing protein [Thiotrichaceae bacterium]